MRASHRTLLLLFAAAVPTLATAQSIDGSSSKPADAGQIVTNLPGGNAGLNLAFRQTYLPGTRAPLFIWQNPDARTSAGYNPGMQIWIGDNPTATPGKGDTVGATIGVMNGNGRFQLFGQNILTGQCGPAEGCPPDHIDGPIAGLEIDIFGSASWVAANRAFRATHGTYAKNGLELYAQGHAAVTSALSIWTDDGSGANFWHEGIALSRVSDIGIHFVKDPSPQADAAAAFVVGSIVDDSDSGDVLRIGAGSHRNYVNAPNFVVTGTGSARFGNQGTAPDIDTSIVIGGTNGTSGIAMGVGGKQGLSCKTDGISYSECLTGAGVSLQLGVNNTPNLTIRPDGVVTASTGYRLPKYRVNALPACNGGNEGMLAAAIDANTAIFNARLTGDGVHHVIAYCNGSHWSVH